MRGFHVAERRHVLEIPRRRLVGDFADRPPRLGGARVDLVVDVGDVPHVGHVVRPVDVAQKPEQHVEHHGGPLGQTGPARVIAWSFQGEKGPARATISQAVIMQQIMQTIRFMEARIDPAITFANAFRIGVDMSAGV